MQGQWIGRYSGTNMGEAIIELDAVGDHFEGRAYIYDDRMDLPSIGAIIHIPKGAKTYSNPKLVLTPLDPATGDFTEWRHLKDRLPGVTFPETASTDWTLEEETIHVRWTTEIGTNGEGTLHKVNGNVPSELIPLEIHTWDEFRRYVRDLEPYKFMFRGQENNKWRLRTAFHRTERADLLKFMQVDVGALHQHLSSLTAHVFNLAYPIENAAFISLAQHHGYPTPLLDWTYSPFIGAYFAFKHATKTVEKVRVFIFDRNQWRSDWNQLQKVTPARPHFSIIDAVSINNMRMVPQQALLSVTNIEDIESYINKKALERPGRRYLEVIDLPIEQRTEVLRELSMMGLTQGSLFPGLDGACNQLKDRFFGF
jgi:hypothetical protein